jgi:integrase
MSGRAFDQWLQQSGIDSGPIFRHINRWEIISEKALTPLAVTQIIKKRAKQAKLENANVYSSHSLRRGLATSASQQGASLKAIMRQGRWQHVNTVLGYFEEGQRFMDNAAACVLDNHS